MHRTLPSARTGSDRSDYPVCVVRRKCSTSPSAYAVTWPGSWISLPVAPSRPEHGEDVGVGQLGGDGALARWPRAGATRDRIACADVVDLAQVDAVVGPGACRAPRARTARGSPCRRAAGRRCGRAPRRSPGRARAPAPAAPSCRTRDRAKRGSALCGSSHQVDALGRAGRLGLGAGHAEQRAGEPDLAVVANEPRIPCSDRPPEPRASPSSTVSAWSSSVCPRSTTRASKCAASCGEGGVPRLPGAGLDPRRPGVDGHRIDAVSSAPSGAICPTTRARVLGRALLQPVVDGHAR